ncbi:MAG: tRNA uridine-5-carboxymethylaminomethyl(34) synthesis GTPase MnmE [Rickettsiales bacterium]|jgi:tRNA modification GTPase|nr:tRNA uridine-5-carboxymethylaminomethyl(34) synthesis GTPase MnmE [Rickettsiales bacterium]
MLNDKKTIFALATPPGKSGVAIIRISGPNAFSCINQLTKKDPPKARQATLRNIINPITNQLIDKAVILTFSSPNSFTGEDVVELHIHGSKAIINLLVKILAGFTNFRLANPGEFSKRAFLNGKMDLTAAEGLADLIESETIIQQQQAMRQMQGNLANLYEDWKLKLIHVLALIEAFLDFPEDDIPNEVIDQVNNEVTLLKKNLESHLNDNNRGEILRRGIHVAILGAPNVGKSSLLNYLAKRDVAIVSSIAGTTRDIIEVHLDLAGYPVTIADTAGIRESEDIIEREGIDRAHMKAENADIKIVIMAANDKKSLAPEISAIMDKNTIIVINKIDQDSVVKHEDAIEISVKENLGLDLFLEKLSSEISNKFSPSSDPIITRERHRRYLNDCLESLNCFTLDNQLELACEDLRLAARALGQIVGNIDVETILDEIFIKFCIGK